MSVRSSSARPAHNAGAAATPPRLRERRRRSRRRLLWATLLLLLALLAASTYALGRPAFRISQVQVYGADASYTNYAREAMMGDYLGFIPRDSTFFVPEHRIRVAIIAAHPEVAAISFFSHNFTGLTMRITLRTAVGQWCGLSPTPGVMPYCYLYDPNGYIYSAVPESDASSDSTGSIMLATSNSPRTTPASPTTLNPFALYGALVGNPLEPLGATISRAAELPDASNLARQMSAFGTTAAAVAIRDDECDIELASGTRVTYLLGHEADAYAALASAKGNLNLADGSIDYVDLRFPGKVYLKKKAE